MRIAKSLTRASACIPIASASLLAAVACSSPATAPRTQTAQSGATTSPAALDQPNGGLDLTSKEAPAFGDPEVEALPLMSDALVGNPAPTPTPRSPQAVEPAAPAYRLALVWGHIPPAHDADATDIPAQVAQWTGSASISGGNVTLLRTIAFGAGDAVAPGASGESVSFDSKTDDYVAGILLRVTIPEGSAATVHFATSQLTADIDLSRLGDSPGGVMNTADGVSGLGWIGFPESTCAGGFVLGRWVKDQPKLGRSFAVVSDSSGAFLGYVRGPWGYAPGRANEVWFHKYIDGAGNPKGLVFGTYGDGAGQGLWGASDEHDVSALDDGKIQGFYSDADDTGDGRGVWLGRWSAPCIP
jgi:hypothetical protein